jgi:hypothetical protein
MARLASQAKCGFYPTPPQSLQAIIKWLRCAQYHKPTHLLDPCCGEGAALAAVQRQCGYAAKTWGIELDADRAVASSQVLGTVVQGSMFDARINPLGTMGLLWLNPPYDREENGRTELAFLKHAAKWLAPHGVVAYLVPEYILEVEHTRQWIRCQFQRIQITRLIKSEYLQFRHIVLLALKRPKPVEPERAERFPVGPYLHLDEYDEERDSEPYLIPSTAAPTVFQSGDTITDKDLHEDQPRLQKELSHLLMLQGQEMDQLSPLLPLRRGHLCAKLISGALNGRLTTPEGDLVIKGYSQRVCATRVDEEEGKEITTDAPAPGIRILNLARSKWYDVV